MADKILFVDDEPSVLDGYKRMLHREFEVDTAVGAEKGMEAIFDRGPYAVVISDMRMPGLNGAQYLAHVRQMSPDTVRMLLTGYTDLSAAMDAVNEGNIFRFLTKPCEKGVLTNAIQDGLVQYRLVTAEKELLEKTLIGSIKVLTDVLSAASPEAFGRSMRIARYVNHMVAKFELSAPWRFEAAAMLSQLGCVTLDPELIQQAYIGERLSAEDQARFSAHPRVARNLLIHIPRMEAIAWMISQQLTEAIPEIPSDVPASSAESIVPGAKILKLAVAFDNLRMRGLRDEVALDQLRRRQSEFDPKLIEALADIKPEGTHMELRKIPVTRLATGMILQQDITTREGALMVPKGNEITPTLLIKLENFSRTGSIDDEIMALVPV
jgi:response regulator RpfG family c-di-GMP phosphodiesterase